MIHKVVPGTKLTLCNIERTIADSIFWDEVDCQECIIAKIKKRSKGKKRPAPPAGTVIHLFSAKTKRALCGKPRGAFDKTRWDKVNCPDCLKLKKGPYIRKRDQPGYVDPRNKKKLCPRCKCEIERNEK